MSQQSQIDTVENSSGWIVLKAQSKQGAKQGGNREPNLSSDTSINGFEDGRWDTPCSVCLAHGATAISADRETRYLDKGIRALRAEISGLGLFVPFASCEGHAGAARTHIEVPRIWFHCHSEKQLHLLGEILNALKVCGNLANKWHVVEVAPERGWHWGSGTVYVIEPVVLSVPATLQSYRRDAASLARHLGTAFMRHAGRLLTVS